MQQTGATGVGEGLRQALETGRNHSMNLGQSRQKVFGLYASEAGLSWNLFW